MADRSASVWISDAPLVLASKSTSRLTLLAAAGLESEVLPAAIDERDIERAYLSEGRPVEGLAAELAKAKASYVSAQRLDAWCLGADQTLVVDRQLLHKPSDLAAASRTLETLAGRKHQLISAFSLAYAGEVFGAGEARVTLTMRHLSGETIAEYIRLAGPSILSSVGAYQLEGLGQHLFEAVEGDHTAVLGLPMLELLASMRKLKLVAFF